MSSNPDAEDIFAAVRQIPAGSVITYGDLAERVGLSRNHARHVGNVLANRPDNDAWKTTPAEDHDIPWWRVVKAGGTLLDDDSPEWVAWAKLVLISEGVAFTSDGRVASLASGSRTSSGGGARARRSSPCVNPSPVGSTTASSTPVETARLAANQSSGHHSGHCRSALSCR